MSWGIKITGTRGAVKMQVSEQLGKIAEDYKGKPEGEDVLAARDRILALVDALDLTSDGYLDWNGVDVAANGSHSTNSKGVQSATMTITVVRTALAL